LAAQPGAYKVLRPAVVSFISYPYEWNFSQLKDAALTTLVIQRTAMQHEMSLKDASAYNIQFVNGRPCLIDTLSFDPYEEGLPWTPYRQFCQHFLAPLALAAYKDVRLLKLLQVHIDGIPLDLAALLLPGRARLRPGLLLHLFAHAASQQRYADVKPGENIQQGSVSRNALIGLLDSLEALIKKLEWAPAGEWTDYYAGDSYDEAGFSHKQDIVRQFVGQVQPQTVWDLGANTGVFSRIAAEAGAQVVAWDVDPGAVELNYQQVKRADEANILPLLLDLTNPSPAIGWANHERMSISERASADLVLALALIHHLAIGNNVPLPKVAEFFAKLAPHLIVEFVPKSDPKVQKLLAFRADVFDEYSQADFEAAFARFYTIEASVSVEHSDRVLYWMKRR
jgi:SAM-dependent methyltransferase